MKTIFLLLMTIISDNCFSQLPPRFKQMRFEEDYTMLKNDSSRNWYRAIKYKALSKKGKSYLSFGGDIRYQYGWYKNENWQEVIHDKNGYVLTRYLAHLDLHASKNLRLFVQLQSGLINGKTKTSPVDENLLEFHQAFIDVDLNSSSTAKFTFRIGRQELAYGSQRLISDREGPNNRQAFDGIKAMLQKKNFKADLLYTHYVAAKKGIFNDGFNEDQKLWGIYTVTNKIFHTTNIDLYYLGMWRRSRAFDDGSGKELRHSFGGRFWGNKKGFRYDMEAVWQFGKFVHSKINAWTASINAGYKFSNIKFQPELGLKTELISGDAMNGDGKLQTFNPLFPRGDYFGIAALIEPSNLFDIHPSVTLEFTKKVSIVIDYDMFWRYSKDDGIYATNTELIFSGINIAGHFIGNQLSTILFFAPSNFLSLMAGGSWFRSGAFLDKTGHAMNIVYGQATIQLKF